MNGFLLLVLASTLVAPGCFWKKHEKESKVKTQNWDDSKHHTRHPHLEKHREKVTAKHASGEHHHRLHRKADRPSHHEKRPKMEHQHKGVGEHLQKHREKVAAKHATGEHHHRWHHKDERPTHHKMSEKVKAQYMNDDNDGHHHHHHDEDDNGSHHKKHHHHDNEADDYFGDGYDEWQNY